MISIILVSFLKFGLSEYAVYFQSYVTVLHSFFIGT